jgi:hypothetical protein
MRRKFGRFFCLAALLVILPTLATAQSPNQGIPRMEKKNESGEANQGGNSVQPAVEPQIQAVETSDANKKDWITWAGIILPLVSIASMVFMAFWQIYRHQHEQAIRDETR